MYGNITTGRLTLPIRRRKRQKGINVTPYTKKYKPIWHKPEN